MCPPSMMFGPQAGARLAPGSLPSQNIWTWHVGKAGSMWHRPPPLRSCLWAGAAGLRARDMSAAMSLKDTTSGHRIAMTWLMAQHLP